MEMSDGFVGVCICAVMPIMIVWICMYAKMSENKRRTELAMAAIEKNSEIDVEQYFKQIAPERLTIKEKLLRRLTKGIICSVIGGGATLITGVLYFVPDTTFYRQDNTVTLFFLGIVVLAVGAGFLASYFIGKKMLQQEMLAELENMREGE